MITKYKQYNESIKSLLVGPTKEEVWKSLGYDRRFDTPEEFFLYMIDGMTIKEQTKDYILWEKDDKTIFEQDLDSNILWVDNKSIWTVLENIFGIESNEKISYLINGIVKEHLKWMGFTPKKWNKYK